MLDGYEPIHGVLLCEGEDVDPNLYYDGEPANLTEEEIAEIRRLHSSDVAIDKDKDGIELHLARCCLERGTPILGICRGSQILNVAAGGSLYQDVEIELCQKNSVPIKHINYEDYDGHRHPVHIVQETPLHGWFRDSLEQSNMVLNVNSYHHQGVKRLGNRFKAMAFSPCGLIEAYYDDNHNPEEGKFTIGLQFHPERMRRDENIAVEDGPRLIPQDIFDYPGCVRVYEDFAKAVISYQRRKSDSLTNRFIVDDHVTNSASNLDFADVLLLNTQRRQNPPVTETTWIRKSKEFKCEAAFLRMSMSSTRSYHPTAFAAGSYKSLVHTPLQLKQSGAPFVNLTGVVSKASTVHQQDKSLSLQYHVQSCCILHS
ncbi:hypothetical protein KP509_14G012400 [Ceratopteris richardii]|nr:hypothetical protein KP509_14G012400 [Ceratopteris richardii]